MIISLMANFKFCIQVVTLIAGNIKVVSGMVKEHTSMLPVELNMKVNGKTVKSMAKEKCSFP